MNITKAHFHELLRLSYEQGYLNGFADKEYTPLCESEDWLSEVIADGEIAGIVIDIKG